MNNKSHEKDSSLILTKFHLFWQLINNMKKNTEKPTPEAKALSLFLMAYKSTSPAYKDKSQRINRQWNLVKYGELNKGDYLDEVQKMLTTFGGYEEVIEKTVRFYLNKTGEWNLQGDDKYCIDAQRIADKIEREKSPS